MRADTWPVLATLACMSPPKYRPVMSVSRGVGRPASAASIARCVRSTRMVGLPGRSSSTVPASSAATMASLKLWCTPASRLASILVPI